MPATITGVRDLGDGTLELTVSFTVPAADLLTTKAGKKVAKPKAGQKAALKKLLAAAAK